MEHLREWRSRKGGSCDSSLYLRRDFVFGLFFVLWLGFGVEGAESSSSLEGDEGSEGSAVPAVATSATRDSRICCASSFVELGLVKSGFPASEFAESRGAGAAGAGSGGADATFSQNAAEGIESGAAGVAGGCVSGIPRAVGCHSRSCCAAWTSSA